MIAMLALSPPPQFESWAVWLHPVTDFLNANPTAAVFLAPLLLLGLWLLMLLVGRRALLALTRRIVKRTSTDWDDVVLESRFLHRLSHLIPLIVVVVLADRLPGLDPRLVLWIERVAQAAIAIVLVLSIHALLDGVHRIYRKRRDARRRPVKGYIQLVKLLTTIIGVAVALASLAGSDVGSLITGIGVSTAVVLFVFKDTILAFIASIHLTAYDMVRVGDWIEMPKHGADGDVIDIALHTVKVQNWDKTITTIPTHELYAESFKNWRGMQESGGRRLKRSLYLDLSGVRFLSEDDIARLREIALLRDYLDGKSADLAASNEKLGSDAPSANHRRLTNIGTFRAYCLRYVQAHPQVHPAMTCIVRQLQATERGVPLEIYLFTKTKVWSEYENIQADIFDHLFAIAADFDLAIFQNPSGKDFRGFAQGTQAEERVTP